jgi:hypothetical protein
MKKRKVFHGFKLPEYHPPTENELVWIEYLRLVSNGADPKLTFVRCQKLQGIFREDAS